MMQIDTYVEFALVIYIRVN